jgi:hypothetical protein
LFATRVGGPNLCRRENGSLGQIFDVDNPRLAYRISGDRAMHRLAGADGSRERAVVSTDDELVAVGGP